jgi:hypothetical protein
VPAGNRLILWLKFDSRSVPPRDFTHDHDGRTGGLSCAVTVRVDYVIPIVRNQSPNQLLGDDESIQMTSPFKTADLWICRFCHQSDTQPFEGFIRPWKKLFFAGFRQLVYFLYVRRRGNPSTISSSGCDFGRRRTLGWVSKGQAGVNVDVPIS